MEVTITCNCQCLLQIEISQNWAFNRCNPHCFVFYVIPNSSTFGAHPRLSHEVRINSCYRGLEFLVGNHLQMELCFSESPHCRVWAQSPQFGAWNTTIRCWSHLYSANAEFCCLCKRCPIYVLHYCLAGAERLF